MIHLAATFAVGLLLAIPAAQAGSEDDCGGSQVNPDALSQPAPKSFVTLRAIRILQPGAGILIKGNHDRAIADTTKAIRINPQLASAYALRAQAYLSKGDHDRAIADFSEAVRLNPRDADGYAGRGIAYHLKGNHDRAIADYTKAIDLDPEPISVATVLPTGRGPWR